MASSVSISIGSYNKYAQICSYDRLDSQTLCGQSPSERYFCIGCYPKFGYHQFPLKLEMDMQQGFQCKSLGRRQQLSDINSPSWLGNPQNTCYKPGGISAPRFNTYGPILYNAIMGLPRSSQRSGLMLAKGLIFARLTSLKSGGGKGKCLIFRPQCEDVTRFGLKNDGNLDSSCEKT